MSRNLWRMRWAFRYQNHTKGVFVLPDVQWIMSPWYILFVFLFFLFSLSSVFLTRAPHWAHRGGRETWRRMYGRPWESRRGRRNLDEGISSTLLRATIWRLNENKKKMINFTDGKFVHFVHHRFTLLISIIVMQQIHFLVIAISCAANHTARVFWFFQFSFFSFLSVCSFVGLLLFICCPIYPRFL